MKRHDLLMSDMHPDYPEEHDRWTANLSTEEVVGRIATQIITSELDGDEITIKVRTHERGQA